MKGSPLGGRTGKAAGTLRTTLPRAGCERTQAALLAFPWPRPPHSARSEVEAGNNVARAWHVVTMLVRDTQADIGHLTHIDAASALGYAPGCCPCREAPSTAPVWD